MTNRAKEIYEAAVSYADKTCGQTWYDIARDICWLARCTDVERREALQMLESRYTAGTVRVAASHPSWCICRPCVWRDPAAGRST